MPLKRTTFGVVEMTTGCGGDVVSACRSEPQLDCQRKDPAGVRANVRHGNRRFHLQPKICLSGPGEHGYAVLFPDGSIAGSVCRNRQYAWSRTADPEPQHHGTAVVDPILIERLSDLLLPKSRFISRFQHRSDKRSCRL